MMRLSSRSLCVGAFLVLILAAGRVMAETPVRVAVLAFRPAAESQARWLPLMDYLNGKVPGYRFQCRAMGYAELEDAISKRAVDFILTNPAHYVLMTHRNGLSSPLATLVPVEKGPGLPTYGGVIFVRADRKEMTGLADLRGRTIAAVAKGSLGGYQAQAVELLRAGLRLPDDAAVVETDMPHDLVVRAVLDRRADAGFVRTGVLEEMAAEGRLDLAQVRVLNRKTQRGFPLLLSTDLYPEWAFAAMPAIDGDLARQVAAALLALPHDSSLARRMQVHGFTIPMDYGPVRSTMEALRLPPFDSVPEFTAEDIWRKYPRQTMAAAALLTVIVLLAAALLLLNRRLAQERRRIQHAAEQWHRLLTALGEGIYGVDRRGRCNFINPAAMVMLGYAAEEVLGRDTHALFHHHREDGDAYPAQECPLFRTIQDGEMRYVEDWLWRKDGAGFPVMMTAAPMGAADRRDGAVVVFRDISERRQIEIRLRQEATTDALTTLPNRRYFLTELQRHLARIQRREERPAAVLMLDLDLFKGINDTYGHAAGDEVLRHLAALARDTVRKGDLLGRLGGEEFAIVQTDATEEQARQFAERLRQQVMTSPVAIAGRELHYTLSIGVSLMTEADQTVHSALERADAALYRAKGGGRNRVEWEPPVRAAL